MRTSSRLLRAALPMLLLLTACATREPAVPLVRHELPEGLHLVHDGISADGRQAYVLGDAPKQCFTVTLYDVVGPPSPVAAIVVAGDDPGRCAVRTAAAAANGEALAVVMPNLGRVDVLRRVAGRLRRDGELRLPGKPGFAFPPPGRNLALSADGTTLLVGALERGCRGDGGCGTVYLYRRQPAGWRLAATVPRPANAEATAYFGQSVLLLPDGALLVGGTGLTGGTGALHLLLPRKSGYELAQTITPEGRDEFFTTDLALSGDGQWLAVGGAQSVTLYRRDGDRLARTERFGPPEDGAGHFGESVALDGEGSTLLVGAPRTDCDAGRRCGIAYRYEREGDTWSRAEAVYPAEEEADADFGHRAALDASGGLAAVEGRAVHLERR